MSSRIDLHTHTTASDGTLEPLALLELAAHHQLHTLAITDHDSTAGYEAVAAQRKPSDPQLIPAIEMNAEGPMGCHLLGYFIDVHSADLQRNLAAIREHRIGRIEKMAQKLAELGVPVDFARVRELAKGTLGRPHLADALMEKGVVRSRQEAFDRFLKKDGPAYVGDTYPTSGDVIRIIREAGGIPVLAHPSYTSSESFLKQLVEWGLGGIETYYPDHSRSVIERYRTLAKTYGLVVTGGSDFHGPRTGRANLGSVSVPEEVLEGLEKARIRG